MSVVFVVVEDEGCDEAASWPEPKLPPELMDSPARESEVMVPAFSTLGLLIPWGSLVTWCNVRYGHI